MAKRINRQGHSERDMQRIRASHLLNRLDAFVNGKITLSAAQVQAARVVIGKVIPDLKSLRELVAERGEGTSKAPCGRNRT